MFTRISVVVVLLAAVCQCSTVGLSDDFAGIASSANTSFPEVKSAELGQGVNFGNMLGAQVEGDWRLAVQEIFFDKVIEAGLDHIRLPISWTYHAAKEAPFTIDPVFLAHVDWCVNQALARNLKIIVDVHRYNELNDDPVAEEARALAIWNQIATRFKNKPKEVFFEVLNEPHGAFDDNPELWNQFMVKALRVIRATNPTRRVLVGPVHYNSFRGLSTFDPPRNDSNLIATIHFYDPFAFTHQGAGWVDRQLPTGVLWSGQRIGHQVETQAINDAMAKAAAWAIERNMPLYLGEFGVYYKAAMADRVRWTKAVRRAAEKRNINWGYWELISGFGFYDPDADEFRVELLQAINPQYSDN